MNDTSRDSEFIEIIKCRLTKQRFYHSLCVAECASSLAEKYGCEKDKAYTAGILHDIMKNADEEEQLSEIKESGIALTDVEKSNPKLWHAISGASFIKRKLNITDEDIINAVRYHTTGRAGMSLLEKVIYIADFVSEDRTYNGIDEIRAAAYESLEKAMMIGLQFSIAEITANKQTLHPDSVNVYNELILNNI